MLAEFELIINQRLPAFFYLISRVVVPCKVSIQPAILFNYYQASAPKEGHGFLKQKSKPKYLLNDLLTRLITWGHILLLEWFFCWKYGEIQRSSLSHIILLHAFGFGENTCRKIVNKLMSTTNKRSFALKTRDW